MRRAGLPILILLLAGCGESDGLSPSVGRRFEESVDLSAIRLVAVQHAGRLKTFDALARETVGTLGVGGRLAESDPVLIYLDLIFAPDHSMGNPYLGTLQVRLRRKAFRADLVRRIRDRIPAEERTGPIAEPVLDTLVKTGRVPVAFLDHPVVLRVVEEFEHNLIRYRKDVGEFNAARGLADPRALLRRLRIIPPPDGEPGDRWYTLLDLAPHAAPSDSIHSGISHASGVPGLEPSFQAFLMESIQGVGRAWRQRDAEGASLHLNRLAAGLTGIVEDPDRYPSEGRRALEITYYRTGKLGFGWVIYFFAMPFLLMGVVYGMPRARRVGIRIFALGVLVHTLSIAIRWILAGRIPNSNMYEAVTAASWFGCVAVLVIERILRDRPVAGIPSFCGAVGGMLAMMLPKVLPVGLGSGIDVVMPVLHRTYWLYIHTNLIIASYAMIFFAGVCGLLYLFGRARAAWGGSEEWRQRWNGSGGVPFAPGGGAGSLVLDREGGASGGLARTFDAATMVFVEIGLLALFVGTILGAMWAGESWGRPWAWDPKEVFAMNTLLVLLILIHGRLRTRDKPLWTAAMAVVGCAVMLFNWIAVNFVIVGLHSYA